MQPPFLILLVDDDPLLLDVLNRASRDSFPEASFAQVQSHSQAMSYIHGLDHYGPKLILLDIDLGSNQSRLDFAAFLRIHPEGRFIPLVMLSVDQLPATIGSAYLAGVSSFTVKPTSFGEWKIYFTTLRLYWFRTGSYRLARFTK